MTGFAAFFAKEMLEIRRTWRAWVVPGLLLFFGVTSPIIALVTPSLLASVAGSQPGLVIQLPEPTAADASAIPRQGMNPTCSTSQRLLRRQFATSATPNRIAAPIPTDSMDTCITAHPFANRDIPLERGAPYASAIDCCKCRHRNRDPRRSDAA